MVLKKTKYLSTFGLYIYTLNILLFMKIEQAIGRKKPFKNAFHKAIVNFLYTTTYISTELQLFLEEYDITQQQYNVLRILAGAYPTPLSTSDIRERMLDKMSDTSRIVGRLLQKELVSKKNKKEDKRLLDVLITEKGLHILALIGERNPNLENCMKKLTEEEAVLLSDILDKLRG